MRIHQRPTRRTGRTRTRTDREFGFGRTARTKPHPRFETVYLDCATGCTHGIDGTDGSHRWTARIGGRVTALHAADGSRLRTFRNGRAGTLCAHRRERAILLASLDGGTYARNRTDGRERWRFRPTIAVRSSPVVADDGIVVADRYGSANRGVGDGGRGSHRRQRRRDGVLSTERTTVQWWYRTGAAVVASAAVADETAYVADCGGVVGALSLFERF